MNVQYQFPRLLGQLNSVSATKSRGADVSVRARYFFSHDLILSSSSQTPKKFSNVTCSYPNTRKHLARFMSKTTDGNILSEEIRGFHSGQSRYCSESGNHYQPSKPVFLQAKQYLNKTAIVDCNGAFSYADILHHSVLLNTKLCQILEAEESSLKLDGQRIALLADQDVSYVIGQFATWMANGISVPLCTSHPVAEWKYFLEDSHCSLLLVGEQFADRIMSVANELGIAVKILPRIDQSHTDYSENKSSLSEFVTSHGSSDHEGGFVFMNKPALIVYTSGTTGRPKGVVVTHGNLSAMISGMISSWAWSPQDVVLHVLPLHHIHGIVNLLLTPLACGATCVMERKFDAKRAWNLLTSPTIDNLDRSINLFMAVPTVYAKMIQHYEEEIEGRTEGFARETLEKKIRLMVSGSAALPQPVSDRWFEITGHRLLERYGMTEIGMALTNPLDGERIVGAVGNPFPDVNVRIVKPNIPNPNDFDILAEGNHGQTTVTEGCENELGELLVKGPTVFSKYWNKPEATSQSFTGDGWFITGDTAVYQGGVYRIVGRTSVDIIKSGGYKISALDVERHLLAHPDIIDVAVVGLSDTTWGQRVAAVVVTKGNIPLELQELKQWAEEVLAPYQTPTILKCLSSIPRNAMGKVNKKKLIVKIFPEFKE